VVWIYPGKNLKTSLDYLMRFILKMSKSRNTKSLFVIVTVLFFAVSQSKVYSAVSSLRDVPQSHWARDSVKTLVEDYGFMQGDPNGNFGGSRALSRYEFAKTMSNMLDYLKKQMEADHKDVEGLVSVMEMFQTEIKALETKLASANSEVAKQNATVNELNEIVVALGDEYNTLKAGTSQSSVASAAPAPESFEYRLAQVEQKVDSLKNRGLFVDTLLRGTLNDVRNVTLGTGKLFKSTSASIKDKVTTDESEAKVESSQELKPNLSVTEEVRADVSKSKEIEATPEPEKTSPAPVQTPQLAPSPAPASTVKAKEQEHSHSIKEEKHSTKQETTNQKDPMHGFYDDEDVDDEDLEDIDSFYD